VTLWSLHCKAEQEMIKIARESPRMPWYHRRKQRAMEQYERTLNAVPEPPSNAQDQATASTKLPL